MNFSTVDWEALARLRAGFLDGTAGRADYWRRESDLASYDATFAQRIGWKWDYVLRELGRLGWTPPAGAVLDWGCGTGIAARRCLAHWGARPVVVQDRSRLAEQFAASRLRAETGVVADTGDARVLLLSHVLTELADWAVLRESVRAATVVICVEPGTHAASRRLMEFREQWRTEFTCVAPCPHSGACGLDAAGNERHWCHQFAPVPAEVFQSADWARFARVTGVDLRSLPVSYLVLDRRPWPDRPLARRVLGRARVYKAHALVLACGPAGVGDWRVEKRADPAEFRRLRKGAWDGALRERTTP